MRDRRLFRALGWVSAVVLARCIACAATAGTIDPQLQAVLADQDPDTTLPVIVGFSANANVRDGASQDALKALGATDMAVLWIINSIAASVTAVVIPSIANLEGVEIVRLDASEATPTLTAEHVPNTLDMQPSTAPERLRISHRTQHSITLEWEPPTDAAGVAFYRLYRYVTANRFASQWVLTKDRIAELSVSDSGLDAGAERTYAVVAVDAAGSESRKSGALTVRTLRAPRAYHPIRRSGDEISAVAGETFNYDVDAMGEPAPSFTLTAAPRGMRIDPVSGLVEWIPAATDVGTATAAVRAVNSEGSADHVFSFPVYPAGTDREPPSPVFHQIATSLTASGCTLAWKAATDNAAVAGYRILAQQEGRGQRRFLVHDSIGPATTVTVTNLKPGTSYRLWVQAYDSAGNHATISGMPPAFITTLNP